MKRLRLVAWIMLAIWASWLTALQAVTVTHTGIGAFTPDLSTLLLVACAARFHKRDVIPAALVLALARSSFSVEPPAALFAAYLAIAILVRSTRRMADLERPIFMFAMIALVEFALASWLVLVHALRGGASLPVRLSEDLLLVLAVTLTTTACAIFSGGFVHLPGLSPLRNRRW